VEPWLAKLSAGDSQAAWDLFAERYRRLMLATIRRMISDHDDVMDVFSTVCQALSANEVARLKRYSTRLDQPASVATWLVVVVRNLTVDWLRQRDGRRRLSVPTRLSPLQQEIYAAVCIAGHSHVEAYEVIRARGNLSLSFSEFLQQVRATHNIAPCPQSAPLRQPSSQLPVEIAMVENDPVETAEAARRLETVLASQPPDVRLAVQLFIVERLSAADVARAVGWPGPKSVYNRVYRALATLREALAGEGIGPGDL
jgi:RNA polymerase sigma factor (sigma-70 family)